MSTNFNPLQKTRNQKYKYCSENNNQTKYQELDILELHSKKASNRVMYIHNNRTLQSQTKFYPERQFRLKMISTKFKEDYD